MRVKMLTDAPGSPDGVTVNQYAEGEIYEVSDDLGEVFVNEDLAEETDEDVAASTEEPPADESEPQQSGKVTEPPENK